VGFDDIERQRQYSSQLKHGKTIDNAGKRTMKSVKFSFITQGTYFLIVLTKLEVHLTKTLCIMKAKKCTTLPSCKEIKEKFISEN